jgi:aarF domain-containing kinase
VNGSNDVVCCSFAEFDQTPIAAASLAQVHRAVLKSTGQEVAVKVQYPGLQQQFEVDITTMHVLSKAVAWVSFCNFVRIGAR